MMRCRVDDVLEAMARLEQAASELNNAQPLGGSAQIIHAGSEARDEEDYDSGPATAAVRRASMDLTRALAKLRRST